MLHKVFLKKCSQKVAQRSAVELVHCALTPFRPTTTVAFCSAKSAGNVLITSFSWSEVCFRQWPRLGSERVVRVFDTPHRADVRKELQRLLLEDNDVNLTGVSGNGKSHNLIRLVMDLRKEGHVVVFIQDVEFWIKDPLLILRELLFAERVAVTANKDELRQECKNSEFSTKRGTRITGFAPQDVVRIRNYVDRRRDEHRARFIDKKFLLVVDQDSKLWKWKANHCVSSRTANSIALVYDFLAVGHHFDAVLFSTSANNGWSKLGQNPTVLHMSEPVPIAAAEVLFPKAFANSVILHLMGVRVSQEASSMGCIYNAYRGYALIWGKAEVMLTAVGIDSARDSLVREVNDFLQEKIESYFEVLLAKAIKSQTSVHSFTCAFMEELETSRNENFKNSHFFSHYDRNLFEWRADVARLHPIFNDVIAQYQRHHLFKFDGMAPSKGVPAPTEYEFHCLQILNSAGTKQRQVKSDACEDVFREDEFVSKTYRTGQ